MRKLEKLQADKWALTKETRKDLSFVRSALAGGWKSGLSPAAVMQIEQTWGSLMRALGYKVETLTAGDKPTFLDLMEFPSR